MLVMALLDQEQVRKQREITTTPVARDDMSMRQNERVGTTISKTFSAEIAKIDLHKMIWIISGGALCMPFRLK